MSLNEPNLSQEIPGSTLSEERVKALLTQEKDSSLYKNFLAAQTHLAELKNAQELEFFLEAMERIKLRKIEEENASYATSLSRAKQEEINRLIDRDNKKQQEHPKLETNAPQPSTHFLQLALAVIAHHLNQWTQATQNIQTAQAALATVQNQWQTAQQTFTTNIVNALTNLGTINPALAGLSFNPASDGVQVLRDEIARRQLPMQAVEHQHLHHVKAAIQKVAEEQIPSIRKEYIQQGKQFSEEEVYIEAIKRGRDKTKRVEHVIALDHIPLMTLIRANKPLVKKLVDLEVEKLLAIKKSQGLLKTAAVDELLSGKQLRSITNKVQNDFIKVLRGSDRDALIRELDNKRIEAQETINCNNNKIEAAQSNLKIKFEGLEQIINCPAFLNFIERVKEEGLLKEEQINRVFGL